MYEWQTPQQKRKARTAAIRSDKPGFLGRVVDDQVAHGGKASIAGSLYRTAKGSIGDKFKTGREQRIARRKTAAERKELEALGPLGAEVVDPEGALKFLKGFFNKLSKVESALEKDSSDQKRSIRSAKQKALQALSTIRVYNSKDLSRLDKEQHAKIARILEIITQLFRALSKPYRSIVGAVESKEFEVADAALETLVSRDHRFKLSTEDEQQSATGRKTRGSRTSRTSSEAPAAPVSDELAARVQQSPDVVQAMLRTLYKNNPSYIQQIEAYLAEK